MGWDATYGGDLMSDMRAIGLLDLRGRQYRQLAVGGETWAHLILGIQRLRGGLRVQGITDEHLAQTLQCLSDPANLIAGPP